MYTFAEQGQLPPIKGGRANVPYQLSYQL